MISDGSSDELHVAKQCLPGGHHKLPPKGLSKGQRGVQSRVRNVIMARSQKQRRKDCFQPLSLSTRAVSQLLHFLVKHIHEHSQSGHVTANISQYKVQCFPASTTNIQHTSLWCFSCPDLYQTLERERSPASLQ